MTDADAYKLLFGPYHPPALRKGDHATCLFRDSEVIITSWTDARIPWPRCRADGTHGGGSGLLVNEELARAIRSESALAIMYWWRVHSGVVWRWRKAFGIARDGTPGSKRLIRAAAALGTQAIKEKEWTDAESDAKSRLSKELGLSRYLWLGYHGPRWSDEEKALLGTMPDDRLARQLGKSQNAVRLKRQQLGIPNPHDARKHRKRRCDLDR